MEPAPPVFRGGIASTLVTCDHLLSSPENPLIGCPPQPSPHLHLRSHQHRHFFSRFLVSHFFHLCFLLFLFLFLFSVSIFLIFLFSENSPGNFHIIQVAGRSFLAVSYYRRSFDRLNSLAKKNHYFSTTATFLWPIFTACSRRIKPFS